ncbi:MAG: nicotinate phosphoribosyltransferase [Saprospiraceae bacterium]|nr:nicotinate phosphoribosyltransferase [Saprospiraceae bacterium]
MQDNSLTLLTDLYQITMAYGYWKTGMAERPAVFHLFYRKNPFGNPYTIACGLNPAIEWLSGLKFTADDVQYLGSLKGADGRALFEEAFLNYLQRLRFSCDLDAIPEGTVVFPNEPLVRVQGPLLQAQLIETALLNLLNFSTLIATKSARVVQAAGEDSVLEFGLRRAQGMDGGLSASRAAYIGGCTATSNVLAGKKFGIPVRGTHAHSWVMCFDSEPDAFSQYAAAMPNNCIFLVDTYNTLEGVRHAITVAQQLKANGHRLLGIRLDSGDLAALSIAARKLLDEAGLPEAAIVASDDLDEHRIAELKQQGAKINVWGVGTRLVTAYDQPALGGVYKLAAIQDEEGNWQHKIKLSEQPIKTSNPGIQDVVRVSDAAGRPLADAICSAGFDGESLEIMEEKSGESAHFDAKLGKSLLVPVFRKGDLVYDAPNIHEIRSHCLAQQALFREADWSTYRLGLERGVYALKQELISYMTIK